MEEEHKCGRIGKEVVGEEGEEDDEGEEADRGEEEKEPLRSVQFDDRSRHFNQTEDLLFAFSNSLPIKKTPICF